MSSETERRGTLVGGCRSGCSGRRAAFQSSGIGRGAAGIRPLRGGSSASTMAGAPSRRSVLTPLVADVAEVVSAAPIAEIDRSVHADAARVEPTRPIPSAAARGSVSDAQWPPPWDRRLVDLTLEALQAGRIDAAAAVGRGARSRGLRIFSGWSDDRRRSGGRSSGSDSPAASGSRPRCRRSIAHERPPELAGEALLHFDVRSDNLCFVGRPLRARRLELVARGNALFDVAAWLPSLAAEGGPPPEDVRPEASLFAPAHGGLLLLARAAPDHSRRAHASGSQLAQATNRPAVGGAVAGATRAGRESGPHG